MRPKVATEAEAVKRPWVADVDPKCACLRQRWWNRQFHSGPMLCRTLGSCNRSAGGCIHSKWNCKTYQNDRHPQATSKHIQPISGKSKQPRSTTSAVPPCCTMPQYAGPPPSTLKPRSAKTINNPQPSIKTIVIRSVLPENCLVCPSLTATGSPYNRKCITLIP